MLTAGAAQTHAEVVDCEAVKNALKDCKKSFEVDPIAIDQCQRRGMDAPKPCRPNEGKSAGVRVGGSSGKYNADIAGPGESPGKRGAQASVDKATINFSCNFPPKISLSGLKLSVSGGTCVDFLKGLFTDKNGESGAPAAAPGTPGAGGADGGGATGDGSGSGGAGTGTVGPDGVVADPFCPAATDTTGMFGLTASLTRGPVPLVCGGAMPLTTYQLSMNAGANSLIGTEHGAYYVWVYTKSGANYEPVGSAIKLPTYLGDWTRHEDPDTHEVTYTCENIVRLTPPIGQMISMNNGTARLVLRLIRPDPDDATSGQGDDPDAPEKFLVLPMAGGVPQMPGECSHPADYYMTTPWPYDLTIDSVAASCEGGADQCAWEGVTAGVGVGSCDMVQLYTKGITRTTGGDVDCTGRTQMAVINRPNLLYPPGTTPTISPITGRTAVMASTVEQSDIYTPADTLIHIGAGAPSFTLAEGGTMLMTDESQLIMSGPATLMGGSGQVTLTNGGQLIAADGHMIREIPPGSTVNPTNPVRPITIKVQRNVTLPAGFMVPTQPNPFVRLPIDPPK